MTLTLGDWFEMVGNLVSWLSVVCFVFSSFNVLVYSRIVIRLGSNFGSNFVNLCLTLVEMFIIIWAFHNQPWQVGPFFLRVTLKNTPPKVQKGVDKFQKCLRSCCSPSQSHSLIIYKCWWLVLQEPQILTKNFALMG